MILMIKSTGGYWEFGYAFRRLVDLRTWGSRFAKIYPGLVVEGFQQRSITNPI